MKSNWKTILKLIISLSIIIYIFLKIEKEEVLFLIKRVDYIYVLLGLLLYISAQVLSAFKWQLLSKALDFKYRLKNHIAFYFIGMFFSLFLPGIVGGDVCKCYYLGKGYKRPFRSIYTVLAERVTGVMTLLTISAIFVILPIGNVLPIWIRWTVIIGTIIILSIIILLPLIGRSFSIMFKSISSILKETEVYWKDINLAIKVFLCSIVFHTIVILINILIALSLNIYIPISYYFIFVPLVSFLSAIPISFNGIGIREASYIFFLGFMGVDIEKALAFSILWFIIVVGASLIGGVIFTFGNFESPKRIVYEESV